MFGHHDDKSSKDDGNHIPEESIQNALDDGAATPAPDATVMPDQTADNDWQHPGTPLPSGPQPISDISLSPAGGFPRSTDTQATHHGPITPMPAPVSAVSTTDDTPSDDSSAHQLIDIKQHALEELEPLIDQLDQTPEEKFRTIMMMIQASDNQALVDKAYQVAHSIGDEKARAQALLDIVNEVNYFTAPQAEQ